MRFVAMLVIGLFMGVLGTVMTLGALRQGTPFHQGLMSVMAHHHAALRRMGDANECPDDAIQGHLRMLRLAGDDLETAFLPTMNDERFRHYAAGYRTATEAALARPASGCAAAAAQAASLGDSCSACHRDFR